ncbi:MAG: adenosylcobinamide-GDP ribazoletransferase [Bryobacter sp.]|nr:adenosylcobinamide-GDP ribazoletransferase [Bryobacter sp.]
MRRLAGAVQFLTVLPFPGAGAPPGAAAPWFPVVGALLGLAGAGLLLAGRQFLPAGLPELFAVALWVLLTGGLHEDGFADCFDAFRAGRSPDRIHAILKDSRVGAFGALAIVFSVLVRWQALVALESNLAPALAATLAVSRGAQVVLGWIAPPAGNGMGVLFSSHLTTGAALCALALSVGAAAPLGLYALWLLAGAAVIVFAARRFFEARLGGVTGDCLGATGHLVEIFGVVLCASIW